MEIEVTSDKGRGGPLSRANDTKHSGDAFDTRLRSREPLCLSCETVLVGSYCHVCGQHAHVHRTLFAFAHDLLHGVFHFDSKIWRTIPLLFWDPGKLTRSYIDGKRAKYVSPLALFLFSVFLMFATFETIGGPLTINSGSATSAAAAEKRKDELRATIVALNEQRARLSIERSAALAKGQPTAAIDAQLFAVGRELGSVTNQRALIGGLSLEDIGVSPNIDTGSKDVDEHVRDALKNPKLTLYKLQSAAYKFAWVVIPLSLPFMWLIFFWKHQYKIYDHAVFVTYSITFIMLLIVFLAIARATGFDLSMVLLFLPIHFYGQLRTAYALTVVGALWRTVALVFICGFVLVVFSTLMLTLGLIG